MATCKKCGAEVTGPYCSACGKKIVSPEEYAWLELRNRAADFTRSMYSREGEDATMARQAWAVAKYMVGEAPGEFFNKGRCKPDAGARIEREARIVYLWMKERIAKMRDEQTA